MQFAFGKARRVTEQSRHRAMTAARIFDALAEHHKAAALAMNRPGFGKVPDTAGKSPRLGERIGMQFRITARQPAA